MASFVDYLPTIGRILGGAYDVYNQNRTRREHADELARQDQYRYDQDRANFEAIKDYNRRVYESQLAAAQGGGGGGRGDPNAGLKQAMKITRRGYKKARKQLQPYVQAGKQVLPLAVGAYGSGIAGLGNLANWAFAPEQTAKLNAPTSLTERPNLVLFGKE